jgi:hypothetical protein
MAAPLDLIDLSRPDQAKLLQRRMTVLGLDIGAWARYEPADFLSGAVPRDQLEAFKRDVLGPRPNDLVIRIRRFRGEGGDPQPRHVATHAGR